MGKDEPIAVEADFRILYEDEEVLAVDKAAPLLMHPTGPKPEPTLWHGLRELLSYELSTGGQLSLINRLDRETSGIVLVAKTAAAARELGRAMMERWEADMKSLGYGMLLLSTQSDEDAQHFYRKLGYHDCGGLILRKR